MQTIPHTSYELIDQLDKVFPPRCAQPGMSLEDIWMEAGSRKVVELLLRLRAETDANILDQKLSRG